MPVTLGYRDLKQMERALAGSAQQIDPLVQKLKEVKAAPELKPEEVAVLHKAIEVSVKLQLRREFPILERVVDNLLSRLQSGEKLTPLTNTESKALMTLLGDLSDAENEALHLLHGVGVIRDTEWKDVVEPHRAESNKVQRTEFNKGKVFFLNLTNGLAPGVAAISLSLLIPGLGGALGAVAIATGMGLSVSPKIAEKIQVSARVETRAAGMNLVQGREVASEPVLLTARVAEGNVLKGDIVKNLKEELALGKLLLEARENANVPFGGYESQFLDVAGKYQAGIEALLQQHEKTPMKPEDMRKEMYAIRAQLMSPESILPLVQLCAAVNVPTDDNTRLIVAHRQVAKMFELLHTQVASGSKEEAMGTAMFILQVLPMMDPEIQGSVPTSMRDMLGKVAKQETVDKAFVKDAAAELTRVADSVLARSGLTPQGAEKRAEQIITTLVGQVLPQFGEEAGDAKLRDLQVQPSKDGYLVTGGFKSGWFGSEGGFSIHVGKDATIDMEKITVDVGPKRARSVAEAAAKDAVLMMTGKSADVYVDSVRGNQKDGYTVELQANGKRSQVAVTSMGLVDWNSIKV